MSRLQTSAKSISSVEQIVTLDGISRERFNKIEASFNDVSSLRLIYLEGLLEIMAPISDERIKSTVGSLLEACVREKGLRFYRHGGFTYSL